jgi:hypothetical protein
MNDELALAGHDIQGDRRTRVRARGRVDRRRVRVAPGGKIVALQQQLRRIENVPPWARIIAYWRAV